LQSCPTFGSAKHSKIQSVIDNLNISELIYCDEEDSRVNQYVNTRKVEVVQVRVNFC
jgi:Fanconi anemia group M protein